MRTILAWKDWESIIGSSEFLNSFVLFYFFIFSKILKISVYYFCNEKKNMIIAFKVLAYALGSV